MALHHHTERVSDEFDVYTGFIFDGRESCVIAGKHHNRLPCFVHFLDGAESNRLAFRFLIHCILLNCRTTPRQI